MAKSATKQKVRAANVPVPQSKQEAAEYVARIGRWQRDIGRIEHDLNDEITKLKASHEKRADPLRLAIDNATEGLRMWCEANRDKLTDGGKVKHADLGTGEVKWRMRPASVTIRKVEEVIARIKAMGLRRFIRTAETIDKEAMLKEADKARTVPGVTIGSEGEDFIVEPFEAAIEGAR